MKKKFLILILIFVVIGSVSIVIFWANQPSTAKISVSTVNSADVKGTSTELKDFETNYFSTKLPTNLYKKNGTETSGGSILGQYVIIDKNTYNSGQLAITIGKTDGATIDEISPVKFRKLYNQDYTQSPTEAGFPIGSLVFNKNDGYEKSVFWLSQNRYASVVVSGGTENKADLDNSLRAAINNWQWK